MRINLNKQKTVLVTGGAGYVGSALVPKLISADYKVKVIDNFWYGSNFFDKYLDTGKLELIKCDIRDLGRFDESLMGVNSIIHLACISNDPSYDLNPKIGEEINFLSFRPLVEAAKKKGVERFIYASSSSVYGVKEEENVTEKLPLAPLTDYSRFKAMCEPIILQESSNNFVTTVVRPATICGYAPRQRLDLAVNILTNHAINKREITIHGGTQYRPNLHITDMCRAYLTLLEESPQKINGEIFNIGTDNLSINQIAILVKDIIGDDIPTKIEQTKDNRSYRVSSQYIFDKLGFKPVFTVSDAIKDLALAFSKGLLPNSLFDSKYFNIKRMKEILENE